MKRMLGLSTIGIVVLIVVVLMLFGAWPAFGFHGYGWGPSGALGFVLLVVVVLILAEKL